MLLSSRRLVALALILSLWLAWGLYLYRLDAQSLWYDEGVTATIAQRPIGALTQWTARDIQPPLYYYVVAGWGRLAGWSEWSLRFVSAWWGLLTVGLMAALTVRLTGHRLAGLLAALLTALHPLLLYYSQEARMYTMLLALGVLTGYLLLRTRHANQPLLWLAYLLTAAAAVYTHYFAFFLLLALGVAYLLDLYACRGALAVQPTASLTLRRTLLPFLLASGGVLLLYGSWVATLFTQLGSDASYWQGPFKLWDALRTLAITFVVGESVLEAAGAPWLGIGLLALLVALLALTQQRPLLLLRYSLPWLLLPIMGVLALAAFVPKFNARYVMLALPALIVLWSSGLAALLQGHQSARFGSTWRWLRRGSGALLLAALLVTFGHADRNWFTDPAFTKAQWRELSAYLHQARQADEAIILVSGHAWPIWDYYAPDLPTVRLPDLEILNVDAVLDYRASALALQPALADQRGAWLVTWQAEVVDPTGVTALHLGLAGEEQAVAAQFWQLGLRHFVDLDATAILPTAPVDQPLAANFADQVRLHGYAQTANDDLLLFWQLAAESTGASTGQGAASALPDLQLNLRTTTADGLPYADPPDRRPADYHYPVPRWRPGQLVVGRIAASAWAGAAALPGAYQLHLGLYDPNGDPAGLDQLDVNGNPLGKSVILDLRLTQPTATSALTLPGELVDVAPGLAAGLVPSQAQGEPGEPLLLTFYWQVTDPLATLPALTLAWQPMANTTPVTSTTLALPTALARYPGQWVRQVVRHQPPLTLAPGPYRVTVGGVGAVSRDLAFAYTLLPSTRGFALPPLALTTAIDLFAPDLPQAVEVRLAGVVNALPTQLAPTTGLTVTLAWQTPADAHPPQADYHVSLQLLSEAGLPVAQVDQALPLGSSTWLPNQVVTQTLTLPAFAVGTQRSGPYRLIVAVYAPNLSNGRLLTATATDYVELAAQIAGP